MELCTSRFGLVEIEADDILFFPMGIAGFEHAQHWVLLADADNDAVAWLQCVTETDVAGELFHWPAGHSVRVEEDAQIVLFSPAAEHLAVMNHMLGVLATSLA